MSQSVAKSCVAPDEEVREVVPSDYAGVMVTEKARSYDAQALSGVRQQKCMAHVLRSISEVVETKVGRGSDSIVVHRPHPRPEVRRDTVRDIARFIEQLREG